MGLTIDDDSVTTRTGFIIPYEVNGKVKYIIDKNSSALTIIRKMLLYTKNGAVKKSNIKFVPDEFVWMISRVYNGENILEGGSDNLGNVVLNSIRGFKGDTEDSLTTISAEGESVMNIISTLSFLIESKNLHQISIDFSYRKHPRDNWLPKNIRLDLSKDWELLCETIDENSILISLGSTAIQSPKFMYDKEPYIVFTFNLHPNLDKEFKHSFETFAKKLKELYRGKNKVIIVKDYEEYMAVLTQLE